MLLATSPCTTNPVEVSIGISLFSIPVEAASYVNSGWVCDMKVDVEAIHQQEGLHLSVGGTPGWRRSCGAACKLRPIVNRPTAAIAADSGGRRGTLWVARRLPAGCQPAPHHASDSTLMSCTHQEGCLNGFGKFCPCRPLPHGRGSVTHAESAQP